MKTTTATSGPFMGFVKEDIELGTVTAGMSMQYEFQVYVCQASMAEIGDLKKATVVSNEAKKKLLNTMRIELTDYIDKMIEELRG
jgi:hypothetical protein